MGRKTVHFAPEFLQALITEGGSFRSSAEVTDVKWGIPADAIFLRGWYDIQRNMFVMLFEHPSWPAVKEPKPYPIFDPVLETRIETKIKTGRSDK